MRTAFRGYGEVAAKTERKVTHAEVLAAAAAKTERKVTHAEVLAAAAEQAAREAAAAPHPAKITRAETLAAAAAQAAREADKAANGAARAVAAAAAQAAREADKAANGAARAVAAAAAQAAREADKAANGAARLLAAGMQAAKDAAEAYAASERAQKEHEAELMRQWSSPGGGNSGGSGFIDDQYGPPGPMIDPGLLGADPGPVVIPAKHPVIASSAGAAAGFLAFGPIGALVGAAVGYFLQRPPSAAPDQGPVPPRASSQMAGYRRRW